jgi:hypothetical protein
VGFVGPVQVGMILNGVEVLPVPLTVLFAADFEPGARAEDRDCELEDMERRGKSRAERSRVIGNRCRCRCR